MSERIGYGRISTSDQNPGSQRDALAAAGCSKIFIDVKSGRLASRPELDRALEYARAGDVLVITRLSRIARSLRNLLELADTLRERGVELVVLKQGIDTTTPTGRFAFHLLGAMDEFLRELIVEGTNEGLAAARARGRHGGRPSKLTAAQVALARRLYEETGPDGKRAHTVAHIAGVLGVSRQTIYRHLDQTTDQPVRPARTAAAEAEHADLQDTGPVVDRDELFDAVEDLAEALRGELAGELGDALADPAAVFLAAWDLQDGDGDLTALTGAARDVLDTLADYRHAPTTPARLTATADHLAKLLPQRTEGAS